MSTDTLQSIDLLTLSQMYRGNVVAQINRQVQTLKFLKITDGAGKNVAWAPEGDGAVAENYSEGADAANFGSDAQASAILSWGLYRANFHVSNLAMDGAASSVDPVANRALWAHNMMNASAKLASTINKDLFAGAGTGTLACGFVEAIGKDDNIYATINRTTGGNEYWKPTIIDPGTPTALTFPLIRDDIRKVYEACGENPDIALCSPTAFNSVGNLFDDTKRYLVTTVNTARGGVTLDAGYQALEVDGMMFVKDKDCTASTIYYVNTNEVEVQTLPSAEQRAMLAALDLQVSADDGFGQVPLNFKYEMLAKTGASEKAEILSTLQLVVKRPNSCGTRKNVAA